MKNTLRFKLLLRKNRYLLLLVTFLLIMTIIGQRVTVQAQENDNQTPITSAVTSGSNSISFDNKDTNAATRVYTVETTATHTTTTTTTTTTTHTTTTTTPTTTTTTHTTTTTTPTTTTTTPTTTTTTENPTTTTTTKTTTTTTKTTTTTTPSTTTTTTTPTATTTTTTPTTITTTTSPTTTTIITTSSTQVVTSPTSTTTETSTTTSPIEPTRTPVVLDQQITTGSSLIIQTNVFLNSQGASDGSGQISTTDGNIFFSVDAGTKLLDAQNQPITQVTASIPTSMPAPPSQNAVVLPYDFGPDGATFEPPMTLTLKYDPATLPQGVNENTLYIAYWDGSQWQVLPSTVDTVAKTLTVMISHFTDYAVMVPLATTTATAAPIITLKSGSNLAIILISVLGVVILAGLFLFFVMRRRNKIVFITGPQTIKAGAVSKMITIQIRNAKDQPVNVTSDIIIDLSSSSGGNFSSGSDGILTITTIKVAEGTDSTSFYYNNVTKGSVTITASNQKLISGKQTETID